ncbi:hypothetical protein SFC66_15980 [Terribacillus saccharophilus]|uniref:hypothetical protein n=1 Tax=Terribacillus saccharophilus TaxID=361277 RepID=UPI0039826FA3
MTQYYYISSPKRLPVGVFGPTPISEDEPTVYKSELDWAGLFFEGNYDPKTKKRFSYVPDFTYKHQVAISGHRLPTKLVEDHSCIEQKCVQLLYDYVNDAVQESGMIEICTCINGTEDRGNWIKRKIYWPETTSPYDIVLEDREICEIVNWRR